MGCVKWRGAAGRSCSAKTARPGPSDLPTEGLIRALLLQTALPQPWGLRSFWATQHSTGREGVWAGTSVTRARGSCTVISIPNNSATTAQPLPRSLSLNNEVTPPSPPVGLPRGLPARCTFLVPGRRGAACSAQAAWRAGSTQAPGRLSGREHPAQNSREHLPSLEWQQLPRCLAEKEAQLCLPGGSHGASAVLG